MIIEETSAVRGQGSMGVQADRVSEPGWAIESLDLALSRWIAKRDSEHGPALAALVLLLSFARRQGHTALCVTDLEENPICADVAMAGIKIPPTETLLGALEKSRLVGAPGELIPLVLDGDLLYFRRLHEGERGIRDAVLSRLGEADPRPHPREIKSAFQQLFASDVGGDVDWQAVAAAAALRSRFVCIAGGPGTGKTATVIRLMALLLQHRADYRIALAAPTGKAANRMAESIGEQLESLPIGADLKPSIPTSASTLHRLLGYRPSQARFTFGDDRKLSADVVIIDEASMIDQELFTSLLAAMHARARLILLGDPHQLPSVDSGFVFGDLCRAADSAERSPAFIEYLSELGVSALPSVEAPSQIEVDHLVDEADSGASHRLIGDSVITLQRGFRFGPDSGIGRLASALRGGRVDDAVQILTSEDYDDLQLIPRERQKSVVRRAIGEFASALVGSDSPQKALAAIGRLRVLSPVRVGPDGVEALNEDLEDWLVDEGIRPRASVYSGKPILVTTNDYDVSLFNGDLGILWRRGDHVVGCFPERDGIREVPLHRLPPHEVAWAMTIHKSQGSEFDEVLIVLPDQANTGRLTRELLYTALTRARRSVTIIGDSDVFADAASRREERVTGLERRIAAAH